MDARPGASPQAGPALAELTRNGSATLTGDRLRLTGGTNQAGSAFSAPLVAVTRFTTSFNLQIGSLDGSPWSLGDGLTFTLQRQQATAIGAGGSGVGLAGITPAVAIKFDILSNKAVLVANGTEQFLNLSSSGLDLRSGHAFRSDLTYDGTNLLLTVTDTTTGATATKAFTVNIASALGGTTAHVGFTAGTGELAGNLDVFNWSFASY